MVYIYHKDQPIVGIYIPYMDPMGVELKANFRSVSDSVRVIQQRCQR